MRQEMQKKDEKKPARRPVFYVAACLIGWRPMPVRPSLPKPMRPKPEPT